jgi:hypothetical protein
MKTGRNDLFERLSLYDSVRDLGRTPRTARGIARAAVRLLMGLIFVPLLIGMMAITLVVASPFVAAAVAPGRVRVDPTGALEPPTRSWPPAGGRRFCDVLRDGGPVTATWTAELDSSGELVVRRARARPTLLRRVVGLVPRFGRDDPDKVFLLAGRPVEVTRRRRI